MKSGYTFLDHTADLAVEVYGKSFEEILRFSFDALAETLGLIILPDTISSENILIVVENESLENRLVETLNQWLFWVQTKRIRPTNYTIESNNLTTRLNINCYLENSDIPLECEVKSVTYHNLIVRNPDGSNDPWRAQWIADL
jgi:SHS2 domain-containing protein